MHRARYGESFLFNYLEEFQNFLPELMSSDLDYKIKTFLVKGSVRVGYLSPRFVRISERKKMQI